MPILPYAIEIRITHKSMQNIDDLEGRSNFLKEVVEPMTKLLKEKSPYHWFIWLFEDDKIFKNCLMINVYFDSEEKRKKAINILTKFIEDKGFKTPESYRIIEHEGNGDFKNFGVVGTEIFNEYLNSCCYFILKSLDKENQKFKEFNQYKFIHCFINASGRYYRQEASYHFASAILRLRIMKDDLNFAVEETKKDLDKLLPNFNLYLNNELTDTLKRLQAEFENYKKWNAKEKSEFVKYSHADLIASILPVLDSFEIALKNTSDKEKFIEGIKMIYVQFHSMLEAEGLRPIKAVGEKFDPYRHEVLMKEDSEKEDSTILEEFQKGYMLNDKVLRHSKVKISGK